MTRVLIFTVGSALAGALGIFLHVPPSAAVPLIVVSVGVGALGQMFARRSQPVEPPLPSPVLHQHDQSERRWQ